MALWPCARSRGATGLFQQRNHQRGGGWRSTGLDSAHRRDPGCLAGRLTRVWPGVVSCLRSAARASAPAVVRVGRLASDWTIGFTLRAVSTRFLPGSAQRPCGLDHRWCARSRGRGVVGGLDHPRSHFGPGRHAVRPPWCPVHGPGILRRRLRESRRCWDRRQRRNPQLHCDGHLRSDGHRRRAVIDHVLQRSDELLVERCRQRGEGSRAGDPQRKHGDCHTRGRVARRGLRGRGPGSGAVRSWSRVWAIRVIPSQAGSATTGSLIDSPERSSTALANSTTARASSTLSMNGTARAVGPGPRQSERPGGRPFTIRPSRGAKGRVGGSFGPTFRVGTRSDSASKGALRRGGGRAQ